MKRISFLSRRTYIAAAIVLPLLVAYACCLPRRLFDAPVSAVLEGEGGTLMGAHIAADGQWRFPPQDTVPQKFAKALIAFEDKRFYYHPGVDPLAVGNALRHNLKDNTGRRGASTLTMQVIRLSRGNRPRHWGTKILETIMATRLEWRYRKEEILALYASHAPFGGNVVGLEAASWRYFGRPAAQLSWAESATLAVLPNAPALIHPGKNRTQLLRKRNALLDRLHATGVLDSLDCALAKEEPLPQKPLPMPQMAPHYLEYLRHTYGDQRFHTSIDIALQQNVAQKARQHIALYRANKIHNIAALVLDVRTGNPVAYCGNVPAEAWGGDPNQVQFLQMAPEVDVIQAPRSSGSTLKPLLYAALLDQGQLLPTQLVDDIPLLYKGFSPRNFYNTFDGVVSARAVIQRSLNVPSVRMLQEYGIENFLQLLQQMGFSTLTRGADIYGLSLILGGAEITLYDLAQAYRSLAAQLAAYGTPTQTTSQEAPLSTGAIWCTFDALCEVNRPEEEGHWRLFHSTRRIAWKTGTSYGNRDAWSIGVTPQYVVAVWVGNCSGEGRPNLTGVSHAAPLMFDIFSSLPSGPWFSCPETELEAIEVCPQSGHPVTQACLDYPANQGKPLTVWAPKAPTRPNPCPYHKIVHLDAKEEYIVNSHCCPINQMHPVSWFVLPPAQEWYYRKKHGEYQMLPPYHPQYTQRGTLPTGHSQRLDILYPKDGMQLAAPVDLDGTTQGVIFSAVHSNPNATLFWHIDNQYVGSTTHGEHKILVIPSKGSHTLTIVDHNGISRSVRYSGD